ncbi:putative extracellular cellulase protein [Zalerion maritima]|uniref:Extracellular cellulase protein n=1 Tax=Zalerion maritima TaxID=339359 RepID=A0AAD5RUR4_9PEZI|nr:putative extracellular cellulase protein [Zalerion maritima]
MRPSTLVAALVASPLAQAAVCHKPKRPSTSLAEPECAAPEYTSSVVVEEPSVATPATTSVVEEANTTAAAADTTSTAPASSTSGSSTTEEADSASTSASSSSSSGSTSALSSDIVDQCPECEESHLDLFQDAFEQLGDASDGIISTSYRLVECGIASPIVLHNKSGTSAYWFSMQVVNANVPVDALEFSTDGGSTWTGTERQDYNFFEYSSGSGTDSVKVRVTSTTGSVVEVSDVTVESDAQVTASSNF